MNDVELAKKIIDWIFVNHDHLAGHGDSYEEMEALETMLPRPFVDSLNLEAFVKDLVPEVKDYHYSPQKKNVEKDEKPCSYFVDGACTIGDGEGDCNLECGLGGS